MTSVLGQRGGNHPLACFVDHAETYGPHVIDAMVSRIPRVDIAVDLGAGSGRDLETVRKHHPNAQVVAVETSTVYAAALQKRLPDVRILDIERDDLPFNDGTVDLIIANQVLEHTKEVFWIFHEVSRTLRIGGHFIFGVPNVASLHNRMLLLFGVHPTQHKLCSAHVRPFSKADLCKFVDACFPDGYLLKAFAGSQFYPFPKRIARALANMFPTGAFSIFFQLEKMREYDDQFAHYPALAQLETNFYTGGVGGDYGKSEKSDETDA